MFAIGVYYMMSSGQVRDALVPFDDLTYLRITDNKDSNTVFRSPLYARSTVDMSVHEDDVIVGIVWIDFYKRDQHFGIRVPDWKTHWLNRFISNTPYEMLGVIEVSVRALGTKKGTVPNTLLKTLITADVLAKYKAWAP